MTATVRVPPAPATAGPAWPGHRPGADDGESIPALAPQIEPTLERHGARYHPGAALPILPDLDRAVATCPTDRAGLRLHGRADLARLLAPDTRIGTLAARHLGPATRPVRAILFDKSAGVRWSLGWHQDRTVAVRARRDVPGYGPWSLKAGLHHVEPPFAVIEAMLTLRIHLDDVPADNAPLLVAPGSHRLGRVPEAAIAAIVARCGSIACLARRGDVWAYATPILHASTAAAPHHAHRRVLHVDYAAIELPHPLAWAGL